MLFDDPQSVDLLLNHVAVAIHISLACDHTVLVPCTYPEQ